MCASWMFLFVGIAVELVTAFAVRSGSLFWLTCIGCFAVFLLSFCIFTVGHRPNVRVVAGFIENTVGGDVFSIFMLLWFLMNFSWFVDATFTLVVTCEWSLSNVVSSLIPLFGLILVFCLYPDFDEPHNDISSRKVVFTGISYDAKVGMITERNMDSLFKPLISTVYDIDNEKVLTGLERYIIVPSKEFLEVPFDISVVGEDGPDSIRMQIEQYNSCCNSLERKDILETLLAELSFMKCGRRISFSIDSPVDYNSFNEVFEAFEAKLQKYYTNDSILYISLGTSILSGALSMLAVKGKRVILYLHQGSSGNSFALKSFYPSTKSLYTWYNSLKNDLD